MIIDTSVIIAIVYGEPRSTWARAQLDRNSSEFLRMSWVNIAEAGMTFRRDNPLTDDAVEPLINELGVIPLDLDQETVRLVIEARTRFPLNFGDCFAYAHARARNETLITLDDDFLKTDLTRLLHPARG